jgi:hypothetical protein
MDLIGDVNIAVEYDFTRIAALPRHKSDGQLVVLIVTQQSRFIAAVANISEK